MLYNGLKCMLNLVTIPLYKIKIVNTEQLLLKKNIPFQIF